MTFLAELDPDLDSLPTNPGYEVRVGNTVITGATLGELVTKLEPVLDDDRILEIIREQNTFQQRFPVLFGDDARLDLTAADVVSYEREARRIFIEADLPPGFYDDPVEDFQQFIRNDTSINELEDRIATASSVASDPALVAAVEQQAGIRLNQGDLTAFFLDPDRGTEAIAQTYARAMTTAEFQQVGVDLTDEQVGRLTATSTSLDANVRNQQAQITSRALSMRRLLSSNSLLDQDELVGAALGEAEGMAEAQREGSRQASRFSGGGGFASGGEGLGGLGTSR